MIELSEFSAALAALPKLPPLDCRIPHWATEELTARACPFCGSAREPVPRRPDDLPVAYCRDCAIWYVVLIPRAEEIEHFYDSYSAMLDRRHQSPGSYPPSAPTASTRGVRPACGAIR
jgi:hypothetical protein